MVKSESQSPLPAPHDGVIPFFAAQGKFDFPSTVPARILPFRVNPLVKQLEIGKLFFQGASAEEAGDTNRAELIYRSILRLCADHAQAHVNLGVIYFHRRKYLRAAAHFRRATKICPDYALAWFNLGNARDELGEYFRALYGYKKAIAIFPQCRDAHYNLALLYEHMHEIGTAHKHWRKYRSLDPSGPWSDHARRQIKTIVGFTQISLMRTRAVC